MSTTNLKQTTTLRAQDIYEIGIEAYLYFYPLVLMDVTRRQMTNMEAEKRPGFGPVNSMTHVRTFLSADFKAVVRPNFDTLYSSCWMDLSEEPVIISVPDTSGRYYLLPMLDMWTDVFASPGTRTTGTGAGHFAVVPAGWQGTLPEGVTRIVSPTPYVWIIGRTQTNGPADYEAVHQVQDGYVLTPLSRWGKVSLPVVAKIDPTVDMTKPPLRQVNTMPASAFFPYAAELMKLHAPHLTDWTILARLQRIGIEPGKSLAFEHLDPEVQQVLERVPVEALTLMHEKMPTMARVANGWQMNTDSVGVYGNFYLKRAIVALIGLGTNLAEDAVYPLCVADAEGNPLHGDNSYVLHFDQEELPPVGAFWSVTMYDPEGFLAANPINRFALGDRDPLQYNADGSLDLYIQHDNPDPAKESNWLPAPRGPLGVMTMRLYAPYLQVLDGRWTPPAVTRV